MSIYKKLHEEIQRDIIGCSELQCIIEQIWLQSQITKINSNEVNPDTRRYEIIESIIEKWL